MRLLVLQATAAPHGDTPECGGFLKDLFCPLLVKKSHRSLVSNLEDWREIKDGSLFMKYIMIWGLLFETLHICDDLTCI